MKQLLLVLLLVALPATVNAHSVCLARADADLNCSADAVGQVFTVDGYVVVWKQFGTRGPGAIYDPSSGCCISIFDIDLAPDLAIGTHIQVQGWMGPFNGLDEIVDNPANSAEDPIITVLDPGPFTFPCTQASCAQIADHAPSAELLESCCIQLCGSFTATGNFAPNTNYDFVDGQGNTCVIRIDGDTDIDGTPIPTGAMTVAGVLGQFAPVVACTGYQLMPRAVTDLFKGNCTVAVKETPWSQVKTLYRED
jgi:hypothetical protein